MSRWLDLLRAVLSALADFFRKAPAADEKPDEADGGVGRITKKSDQTGLDDPTNDAAAAVVLRQRIDAELEQVQAEHREEQRHAEKSLADGRRDHLDRDW